MSKKCDHNSEVTMVGFDAVEISHLVQSIWQLTAMAKSENIDSDLFKQQCWKSAELIMDRLFNKLAEGSHGP